MMTFTTTLTTANRKRSRPMRTATTRSMQLLALVVLLVLSQASAFHASTTTPSKTASIDDHWTLEDLKQMDLVYDRYVQAIVQKYGANWEEDYELVVNKVEIYEAYLQFEERKAREAEEAEERRLLTLASHKALLQLDQQQQEQQEDYSIETWEVESQNRTGEPSSLPSSLATAMDLPTRSHMFVLNTGSYFNNHNNNNRKSTTATTTRTIVTAQGGTQSVIGSI